MGSAWFSLQARICVQGYRYYAPVLPLFPTTGRAGTQKERDYLKVSGLGEGSWKESEVFILCPNTYIAQLLHWLFTSLLLNIAKLSTI